MGGKGGGGKHLFSPFPTTGAHRRSPQSEEMRASSPPPFPSFSPPLKGGRRRRRVKNGPLPAKGDLERKEDGGGIHHFHDRTAFERGETETRALERKSLLRILRNHISFFECYCQKIVRLFVENLGCNFFRFFSPIPFLLSSLSPQITRSPFHLFLPFPRVYLAISRGRFVRPSISVFSPPSFPHPFNGHTWLEEKGRGNHFATKIFRLFSGGGHEGRASPFSPFFWCICLFSAVQTLRQKPCQGKMLPHKILFSFGQTTASAAQSSSDQMSRSNLD